MLHYNNNHSTATKNTSISTLKSTLALVFVACFGLGLIFTVGFAQGQGNVMHNAAHDSRHSAAFPCH